MEKGGRNWSGVIRETSCSLHEGCMTKKPRKKKNRWKNKEDVLGVENTNKINEFGGDENNLSFCDKSSNKKCDSTSLENSMRLEKDRRIRLRVHCNEVIVQANSLFFINAVVKMCRWVSIRCLNTSWKVE